MFVVNKRSGVKSNQVIMENFAEEMLYTPATAKLHKPCPNHSSHAFASTVPFAFPLSPE